MPSATFKVNIYAFYITTATQVYTRVSSLGGGFGIPYMDEGYDWIVG
jgi:hypothetical protein